MFTVCFSDEDEYMAFGISGSETSSQMIGSDLAIAYMDGLLGTTADYNISGKFPVSNFYFWNSWRFHFIKYFLRRFSKNFSQLINAKVWHIHFRHSLLNVESWNWLTWILNWNWTDFFRFSIILIHLFMSYKRLLSHNNLSSTRVWNFISKRQLWQS